MFDEKYEINKTTAFRSYIIIRIIYFIKIQYLLSIKLNIKHIYLLTSFDISF